MTQTGHAQDSRTIAHIQRIVDSTGAGSGGAIHSPSSGGHSSTTTPVMTTGGGGNSLPPGSGGGSGHSGSGFFGRLNGGNSRTVLILVIAFVALITNQLFWKWRDAIKQDYNNTPAGLAEIQIEATQAQKKLVDAEAKKLKIGQRSSVSTSPTVPEKSVAIDTMQDGTKVFLSENKQFILHGPMSVVFVNSAERIKSFSGDFKLHVENSENYAWTPGFSQDSPPMSVDDFLRHFRKRKVDANVRIFVNQGVVQINT